MKVPIKSSLVFGLIPEDVLIRTSATNFTLNIVATMVFSDTENTTCCPIGSILYKGFCAIVTAIIQLFFCKCYEVGLNI